MKATGTVNKRGGRSDEDAQKVESDEKRQKRGGEVKRRFLLKKETPSKIKLTQRP
jgi:hypothetical protein